MPTCRVPNVQAIRSRSQRLRLRQLFGRRHRLVEPFVHKIRKHRAGVFAKVSVQAISLRTDGIVRTITSWDLLQDKFALSANQLMEIKLASYSHSNSRSTTSTSCPFPRRRSTRPLLLRRRTLQLRLQLSNSTRASRRSVSISRVTDASAACPFRPRLWSVI